MNKPVIKVVQVLSYPVFIGGYAIILLENKHPLCMSDTVLTSQILDIKKDGDCNIFQVVTENSIYTLI